MLNRLHDKWYVLVTWVKANPEKASAGLLALTAYVLIRLVF